MEDKNTESNVPAENTAEPNTVVASSKKKKSSFKWVLLAVFIAIIVNVIRPHKTPKLAWVDYETGIKTAKLEDKPILIAFYKEDSKDTKFKFCKDMWANTYTNQAIIDFIERNFVPIFVDGGKRRDLEKEYNVDYYPTHFIKTPDNKKVIKSRRGYDTPGQFTPFLKEALKKMNRTPK